MLKKLFLPIILLLLTQTIVAQDIVVVGQVLSAENSEPLQAASVWFKGTNIGCTTNEEGFFMLRSNEPQRTLIASVVGYKQRQIKLDYGKDQMIRIYLKEDISILDEVIEKFGNMIEELEEKILDYHGEEKVTPAVTDILAYAKIVSPNVL